MILRTKPQWRVRNRHLVDVIILRKNGLIRIHTRSVYIMGYCKKIQFEEKEKKKTNNFHTLYQL